MRRGGPASVPTTPASDVRAPGARRRHFQRDDPEYMVERCSRRGTLSACDPPVAESHTLAFAAPGSQPSLHRKSCEPSYVASALRASEKMRRLNAELTGKCNHEDTKSTWAF